MATHKYNLFLEKTIVLHYVLLIFFIAVTLYTYNEINNDSSTQQVSSTNINHKIAEE